MGVTEMDTRIEGDAKAAEAFAQLLIGGLERGAEQRPPKLHKAEPKPEVHALSVHLSIQPLQGAEHRHTVCLSAVHCVLLQEAAEAHT
jgi:hypothetical protein